METNSRGRHGYGGYGMINLIDITNIQYGYNSLVYEGTFRVSAIKGASEYVLHTSPSARALSNVNDSR